MFNRPIRHLTRREYAENTRMLNSIKDLPPNHNEHNRLAYGLAPFFYDSKKDEAPMFPVLHVRACSPIRYSKYVKHIEQTKTLNLLLVVLLVLVTVLLLLVLTVKGLLHL